MPPQRCVLQEGVLYIVTRSPRRKCAGSPCLGLPPRISVAWRSLSEQRIPRLCGLTRAASRHVPPVALLDHQGPRCRGKNPRGRTPAGPVHRQTASLNPFQGPSPAPRPSEHSLLQRSHLLELPGLRGLARVAGRWRVGGAVNTQEPGPWGPLEPLGPARGVRGGVRGS